MERVLQAELLDADQGSPREIHAALRSINFVNRLFGGNRMHTRLLVEVARRASTPGLQILEVASGQAAVLQHAALRLINISPQLQITLLDRSPLHLPSPQQWSSRLPQPRKIIADALAVPLPDNSVDIVSCCLFLHHLPEPEAAQFLAESLRLARVAVVINDLERTRLHFWLARLFSLADPSPLSRHDGPVSVRQAYTRSELDRLLQQTGHRYGIRRGFLFRLGAILWK
jgi:ubiquinone/menaquinone biosynthesis C-methylase UbiE